ncbi:MAG: tetratricopeptide repeat protein, partial [ANME-2 cluster archaeon]
INEKMGMEICKHANIEALAVASIRKLGNRYAIDLKILNPQKNTYLLAAKEEDNGPENIFAMIDRLAEKTRKGLNEKAEEIQAARQKVADVTTTNLEAYEHYFQGEQFINQLKIKEAIEEFKKAVAIDSTFAQAYYRLAYAESWERGNEVIKKKHLDHALKHINRMPEKEQYLVRATNAIIDNNYKTGVAILKEMEQIYPDDKEMIYNIGDWSFHLNDDTTAVAYLEKTLQIDPNHQRALQHLTWTYRDMGNYNKMLETAQRYVAVSSSAESYQLLVDAFNQLGQLEQGISTLKQARDLFPDNSLLQGEIAKIYAYQGKYEEAEKYLKSMTGEEKTNSSRKQGYLVLGDLYAYLGKYILSMNMYDNLIELYRQENNMHMVAEYGIFKAYWMMWGRGKKDGVLEEVEKTMEVKNPGCFAYNLTLALIYIDFKYFDKAYAASEEYVNANYQHSVKAQEHFNKEEWENAINEFKNFGNLDANPIARYKIAQCYFELGKWQKAIEETKAAQNLYSGFGWWVTYPKTFYLLGKIYEKNGDVNPAIKNYEKFLELWKNADEDLPDLIDGKKRLAKLKDV